MGPARPIGPTLHVATDLDAIEGADGTGLADDVVISGRAYRRLDPAYYTWLRRRMARVKQAADAGRLASSSYDVLRERFNVVHTWAIAHLGEDQLLAAARGFDERTYQGPRIDDDDDLSGARLPLPPGSPRGPTCVPHPAVPPPWNGRSAAVPATTAPAIAIP